MNSSDPLSHTLFVLVLLQFKHFICDGPLQTLAMVQGKSHYGRLIGVAHAAVHAVGTALVLAAVGLPLTLALQLALLDGVIHYHVDYTKENIVKSSGWTTHDGPYWWTFTADQMFHHMTYVLLVWLAFRP